MSQPAKYPERQPILNLIQNPGAVPFSNEPVLMPPEFVRALQL